LLTIVPDTLASPRSKPRACWAGEAGPDLRAAAAVEGEHEAAVAARRRQHAGQGQLDRAVAIAGRHRAGHRAEFR
jgi:hypothetical protein